MSDYTLNTFHPYEVCILKDEAIKILSEVDRNGENYSYAERMISALEQFSSIDQELVPKYSLLREFIGGSSFEY